MTLHIARTGTGPALVLLHGLGVSSWMWDEQVAALQAVPSGGHPRILGEVVLAALMQLAIVQDAS